MKVNVTAEGYAYRCPCGDTHHLTKGWQWNGDREKPTFTPSVMVTTGHFIQNGRTDNGCWCTYAKEHPEENLAFGCYRCHSYVRDGMVQFLADCTHPLAGQTVALPDWR